MIFSASELRAAAEKHEEIARRYHQLAELLDQGVDLSALPYGSNTPNAERRQSGQKRALYEDLQMFGPSSVKEIHERTGIPVPTIYFVSQDTKLFKKKGKLLQLVGRKTSVQKDDQSADTKHFSN